MNNQLDYSILDDPRLLQFVFFPRADWTLPPAGTSDHYVSVEQDLSIFCRFYPVSQTARNILYFHGNGEVACDHDWLAPLYNEIGINLFVADYRGYGLSGGQPTFASMATDAHRIFNYYDKMLQKDGYSGRVYVMGRSLGSQSAMELAANYSEKIRGLIIESGFIQNSRLLKHLDLPFKPPAISEFENASIDHIGRITIPLLIIHGDSDILIPHIEAETIFDYIGSRDKKMVTIEGAGHNDIIQIGVERYFEAIRQFIFLGG